MNQKHSRRQMLARGGAAALGVCAGASRLTAQTTTVVPGAAGGGGNGPVRDAFGYCLNTSTISGANLGIEKEIQIAADAGYQAIEPWLSEIHAFEKKGGNLDDLRKRIEDAGLVVADAIAFSPWLVDDDAARAKGLEQMKKEMEIVARIGGKHIAAPPSGATDHHVDPAVAAERYRAVLELGATAGVAPLLELWGFSKSLNRLGEVTQVAIESNRADASMLLDIFHLYKGGSNFAGLRQINGASLQVIHMNDYPAAPPREKITDQYRVYPGDGVAPLAEICRTLRDSGFRGFLSLELFNRDYWRENPVRVAKTGLEKTRAVVRKSLA